MTPDTKRRLAVGIIQWLSVGVGMVAAYMLTLDGLVEWDWFRVITGALAYVVSGLAALAKFFGSPATEPPVSKPVQPTVQSPVERTAGDVVRSDRAARKPFKFGKTSEIHLSQSDPDLGKVHRRALEISSIDFSLICSLRSVEKQRENIRNGVSWTMESRHLERPLAKAIDHVPLVNGVEDWSWEAFTITTNALKQASKELGIPCVHGIDFAGVRRDGAHTELSRTTYAYMQPDLELA